MFEGLRYKDVCMLPSSCFVTKTSRNAIEFSSSSSRVNWTRGWTALRQSLNDWAGVVVSGRFVLDRRPGRGGGSRIVVRQSSTYVKISRGTEGLAMSFKQLWCFFLRKNIFLTLIYTADIAIQMSNIDNFDIDQMSSKFAKR